MEVRILKNVGLKKPLFEHICADDCVKGRGRFYQGTVNKTKQGLPCQHWDSQLPHSHNRPPDVFPEVQNAENFCRNAGGEEPSPWCYTMDPTVRWQHCDIPVCGKCCLRFMWIVLCVQNLSIRHIPKWINLQVNIQVFGMLCHVDLNSYWCFERA